MDIFVSNLPCLGLATHFMKDLPKNLGIEIFSECGSEYFWKHLLPGLLEGRPTGLSVHGPFQRLNLADATADFSEMKAAYLDAFAICEAYGAKHCVCHPHDHGVYADRKAAVACSVERILELNRLAQERGITLLVENMPDADTLFSQEEFISTFAPHSALHFLIDIGHAHLHHWNMTAALSQLGDRIQGYHLHDNLGDFDTHLPIGAGTFDWDTFWDAYQHYTPNASLVLEYNNGTIEELAASAAALQQALIARGAI